MPTARGARPDDWGSFVRGADRRLAIARRRRRRRGRRRPPAAAPSGPGRGRASAGRRTGPGRPARASTTRSIRPPTRGRWTRRAASAPSSAPMRMNEGAARRSAAELLRPCDAREQDPPPALPSRGSERAARGACGEARRVQVGDPRRRAGRLAQPARRERARGPVQPAPRPPVDGARPDRARRPCAARKPGACSSATS